MLLGGFSKATFFVSRPGGLKVSKTLTETDMSFQNEEKTSQSGQEEEKSRVETQDMSIKSCSRASRFQNSLTPPIFRFFNDVGSQNFS